MTESLTCGNKYCPIGTIQMEAGYPIFKCSFKTKKRKIYLPFIAMKPTENTSLNPAVKAGPRKSCCEAKLGYRMLQFSKVSAIPDR